MYLHLTPNLLHFLPDLGALNALRPTFMKSTPGLDVNLTRILQRSKNKTMPYPHLLVYFIIKIGWETQKFNHVSPNPKFIFLPKNRPFFHSHTIPNKGGIVVEWSIFYFSSHSALMALVENSLLTFSFVESKQKRRVVCKSIMLGWLAKHTGPF
jgi:hypothetical protein